MSYSPFRHMSAVFRKDSPVQLTFFLTKRCNARCSFCFYNAGRNTSAQESHELSLDEIKKISSSMGNLLWLAFSGGEIFLREDLDDITKVFYEKNRPALILFSTNGLLTDVIEEKIGTILRICRESTIVVKLSLDGMEDVHDTIRGKGSFQKTIKTYHALAGLLDIHPNLEAGINTVFCSANQDSMDEIIDYVRGMDHIKTHTVSLIRGEGLQDVDIEKYRRTADTLARNLKSNKSSIYRFKGARLKAAQDILQRRLIYETELQKKQMIPCFAGRLNLVLTETGDVYPCESFTMKMGNVRNSAYDIIKLLKSGNAGNIMKAIREKSCFCSHECYMMTNILFNIRMYPRLMREYFQLGSKVRG